MLRQSALWSYRLFSWVLVFVFTWTLSGSWPGMPSPAWAGGGDKLVVADPEAGEAVYLYAPRPQPRKGI